MTRQILFHGFPCLFTDTWRNGKDGQICSWEWKENDEICRSAVSTLCWQEVCLYMLKLCDKLPVHCGWIFVDISEILPWRMNLYTIIILQYTYSWGCILFCIQSETIIRKVTNDIPGYYWQFCSRIASFITM